MTNPLDGNGVALMPCPFCGNRLIAVAPPELSSHMYTECYAFCGNCDMRGPVVQHRRGDDTATTKRQAVAAWNRRTASPAPSQTAVEPVANPFGEVTPAAASKFLTRYGIDLPKDMATKVSLAMFLEWDRAAASTLTAQAAALVAAEKERDERRGTELAVWMKVKNLEASLEAAESEVATLKGRIAELEAGLEDVFRLNDECSGSEPSISALMRAVDRAREALPTFKAKPENHE